MQVAEKFVSIDGEGPHAGELAAFIRFKGCNLDCDYCDTKWANRADCAANDETAEDLAAWVQSTGTHNVTLTGGEATLFTEWVGALAGRLAKEGIRVHLETAGQFDYESVKEHLLPYVSSIYMDIKLMDPAKHKEYCGVENGRILENFKRLLADGEIMGFTLLPRTPLVPGITDTDENLAAIAQFYVENGVKRTELLPYNPTWYGKNDKLGIQLAAPLAGLDHWQSREKIEHCKSIFRNSGIEC